MRVLLILFITAGVLVGLDVGCGQGCRCQNSRVGHLCQGSACEYTCGEWLDLWIFWFVEGRQTECVLTYCNVVERTPIWWLVSLALVFGGATAWLHVGPDISCTCMRPVLS
jgi:hypothetical protein